ncbi:MAG: AEC family transporter [Rhodospirillaceae bacterium]|nr:AEC family transporter [Rhodospirillaceae bacterium]
MYQQLLDIIAPVLIVAGLGFIWGRLKRPFDLATVTGVTVNIAVPCLVLSSLSKLSIDLGTFATMAGAAAVALAAFVAVGYVVLKLARLPHHTFLPAMAFGNAGNLGLPLCLFAFGDAGLALGIAGFAVNSIVQMTAGQMIAAGKFSPKVLLRTPVIYAVAVALVLMATHTPIPKALNSAFETLGRLAIPIMLLALGVSLARLAPGRMKVSGTVAVLRLVTGFAGGVAIAALFGLEGAARGVLIIQCAMPAAVFNYLWAQVYGRDASAVAGVVVISTGLGFLVLPLILAVALDPGLLSFR